MLPHPRDEPDSFASRLIHDLDELHRSVSLIAELASTTTPDIDLTTLNAAVAALQTQIAALQTTVNGISVPTTALRWVTYTTDTRPSASAANAGVPYLVQDPGAHTRGEIIYKDSTGAYKRKILFQPF